MSSSNTNTCLASAMLPNTAAMALRASPGTRWRSETRTLYMPPEDGVANTATGSRTAVTIFASAGDGVWTIEYYSTDAAGNVESVKSTDVLIDTTGPSGTVTDPSAFGLAVTLFTE